MNLRHAVALASVGWYLVIPPSQLSPTKAYQQPLKMWQVIRSFDTADACEDFKQAFFDNSQQKHALGALNLSYRDYMFAECIASDDRASRGTNRTTGGDSWSRPVRGRGGEGDGRSKTQ